MIRLVSDLLRCSGVIGPPVRIPLVTSYLDITVRATHRLPPGWDATLIRGRRATLLSYSPHTSVTRQRFSIAHEVGHALLHRGQGSHDPMLPPNPRMEMEADAFAAELLMPTEWIVTACLENPTFDYLRDIFWVSKQAMKIRLRDMGLLCPRTTYDIASYAGWSTADRDTALAYWSMLDPFNPVMLHASVTCDPYEDYLLMRGAARHPVPVTVAQPSASRAIATLSIA